MPIYVFLGPPGSGKGTQAKILSKKLNIPHISMGDLLREEVKNKTPLGLKVEKILSQGKLVPDDITVEIAEARLKKSDCKDGFVLDGFPRTIYQAEMLDEILKKLSKTIDKVIYFSLSLEKIVERLSLRRSCRNCGAVYHLEFNPPKDNLKCDICGGELFQRSDDKEDVIKKRYEVYLKETEPLISYYREKNLLFEISSEPSIEEVSEEMFRVVGA